MWVLILSFMACNQDKRADNDVDVPDVAALPAGMRPMATRVAPDSKRPARRYIEPKEPVGTALITTDCYQGQRRPGYKPVGSSGKSYGAGVRGSGAGAGGARKPLARPQRQAPVASAPALAPPPADAVTGGTLAPAAESTPSPMAGGDASESQPVRVREQKKKEDSRGRRSSDGDAADAEASEDEYDPGFARPMKPVVDWGATVYLSNDDSMSLASAQRMLWAVDQGRSFSTAEIRPHELLNYFSFDTVPVEDSDLFSVLGSAEAHGDELSVALAVQGAMPPRQPLDLSLVIDRSGSMRAEGRMEYVKKGLLQMTEQLRDGDRIDLTLFDSRVCSPVQNYVVGRDDPSVLTDAIHAINPRGSTDLDGGLREGYRIQTARDAADVHHRNRRILLLTDAFLNTGNVDQNLVSEIGRRFEEDGIRVTGVGVGREFNDKMLDLITEKGKGAYVYLGSEAVVNRVFGSGFDSLVQTIAHDVQFSIDLPDSLAMEKFYGEEASTNPEDVQPINYYAGTSQVFLQDLKIRSGGVVKSDPITFKIAYREADTGEPAEQIFHTTVGDLLEGDTHNLNKAQALMKWTDLLTAKAMGDRSCSGLREYRRAASQVQGDAEIAYVSSLTGKLCGVDMSQTVAATGVTYKVKVDSDMPIPEVQLACGGEVLRDSLSGSDTVARFTDVLPGSCSLVLQGNVPMRASVEVPSTGGDVRCLVRGGRVRCE